LQHLPEGRWLWGLIVHTDVLTLCLLIQLLDIHLLQCCIELR
jgi:hypothetical protein